MREYESPQELLTSEHVVPVPLVISETRLERLRIFKRLYYANDMSDSGRRLIDRAIYSIEGDIREAHNFNDRQNNNKRST